MEEANRFQLAVIELTETLLERAHQSKADASQDASEFAFGRNMAYVEVISVLARIADQFEIPRSGLKLPVDPENELIWKPTSPR